MLAVRRQNGKISKSKYGALSVLIFFKQKSTFSKNSLLFVKYFVS